MAFVDVLIATLKTNPCFESKVNMGYGVAMFRLVLIISCLGFVVGCIDGSASEPMVMEPTAMEPTVMEPTSVEPKLWFGDAEGDSNLDRLVSGRYTEIVGSLIIHGSQTDTIDLPHLQVIDGDVSIREGDNLTSIGFPQLQSVGGDFGIAYNKSLTTLALPRV